MLQETRFQVQVLKPCKFVQESSEKVLFIKARQLVSIEVRESCSTCGSIVARQIGYLLRFMKFRFSVLFFIQSMNVCLGFLFSHL